MLKAKNIMRKIGVDNPPNLGTLNSSQPGIIIRTKINSRACKRNANTNLDGGSQNQRPRSIEPGSYGSRAQIERNVSSY